MDYKDLTSILLKITGAALIFLYLSWMPSIISAAIKHNEPFYLLELFIDVLPNIVSLLLAIFLFIFPATIANKLIGGGKLTYDETFVDSLQIVAIRLIGIYHIFTSIIDLIHHFSKAILGPAIYEKMGVISPTGWTPDLVGWTIATFVELAIALWLTFGAEGILRFIQQNRGRA